MKKILGFVGFALIVTLLSCGDKKRNPFASELPDTQTFTYNDSNAHLVVSLSLELPMGDDSITMQVRDSLIADFVRPYAPEGQDPQAIVDNYGRRISSELLAQAQEDYAASTREDIPQWEFRLSTKHLKTYVNYDVYQSQGYVYYGGAHGGVTGTGALTFNRHSGEKIQRFLKPEAIEPLQYLLRRGLCQYYLESGDTLTDEGLSERLQIEGTQIPLPQQAACPNATGDSLILTYGQYEIACYADGMPTVTVAISDVKPYLTPAALRVLHLQPVPCR